MYKNANRLAIVCLMIAAVSFSAGKVTAQGNGNGKGNGNGGGGNNSPPYSVVDLLGLPGGSLQSEAVAVSEPDGSGAVELAGNSHQLGDRHPAKWSVNADGSQVTITDLGLLPGELSGYAEDLNEFGELVFHTVIDNDPQVPDDEEGVAWVADAGLSTEEIPKAGGVDVNVTAINNSGEIVGWIVSVNGTTRSASGALWRLDASGIPSAPIDLGSFIPKDISESGIMAGQDESSGLAAIGTLDASDNLTVTPLGTLAGDTWSRANGISNDGTWVVGRSRDLSETEAFRWSIGTGMVGLGRLGGSNSEAEDVNDAGDVVGITDTGGGKWSQTAFLWTEGQMSDLNSLVDNRAHLSAAFGINNTGHVAGYMDLPKPTSERHGYLLIPSGQ